MTLRRRVSCWAAFALVAGACSGGGPDDDEVAGDAVDVPADMPPDDDAGADTGGDDDTQPLADAVDNEDPGLDHDAAPDADAGDPLAAELECPPYAQVNTEVICVVRVRSPDAAWSIQVEGAEPATNGETVRVVWDAVGRYVVTLQARVDAREVTSRARVVVHDPVSFTPSGSSSVAVSPAQDAVCVVSPDSDEVAVFDGAERGDLSLRWRADTCATPRAVAPSLFGVAVACQADDTVRLHAWDDGAEVAALELPYGTRPFGIVAAGQMAYVAGQGRGDVVALDLMRGAIQRTYPVGPDARAIAMLPDGRVAVTRWRSPNEAGRIYVLDLDSGDVAAWDLPFDPRPMSDTETGGVPSYLQSIAVSPTGGVLAIPATQANIGTGRFRDGHSLTFETTVRAMVAYLDTAGQERTEDRKLFDDRGLASAAAFSPYGDFLYLTDRGSRTIERIDVFTGGQAGTYLDVGFAPQGIAVSPTGAFLYVDAYLSRELAVYAAEGFGVESLARGRHALASREALSADVLLGKRLFNDSFDPRLSKSGYIACAHCHLDGESDHRVWDFTDRGEGLRNTTSLLGRAGTGHGPVHWSANFDEIQDFEHDIRGPFQGHGLMTDADFHADGRDTTLGTPKAGVSPDLDALAAYVSSLSAFPRSPHRSGDGMVTEAAIRGASLFDSAGCGDCHAGAAMTDSGLTEDGAPRLHNVGTLTFASGGRLGGPLTGLDTPTVRGIWNDAPYLHDGSAATVRDALERDTAGLHGTLDAMTTAELDDLEAYLLSLE